MLIRPHIGSAAAKTTSSWKKIRKTAFSGGQCAWLNVNCRFVTECAHFLVRGKLVFVTETSGLIDL